MAPFQSFLSAWVPTPAGAVFVAAAWLLFLYAASLLANHARVLRAEAHRLRKLRETPREKREAEIRLYLEEGPRSTLVGKLISTLWEQRLSKAPDLDAIQTMVSDAAASPLAFPRAVPNVCLLLGLIGTVLGMAGLVQALAPGIQEAARSTEPMVMARAIAGQFDHLRTAFSCTLHGILAAALLALMTARVEQRQNAFLNDLFEFGLRGLAPQILPESLEQQLAGLRKNLADSVLVMHGVSDRMQKASDGLALQITRLDEATDRATTIMEATAEHMDRSAASLGEGVKALNALQVEVHSVYVGLMERHDRAAQEFRAQVEAVIGKMGTVQDGFRDNARAIIDQLQTACENYTRSTEHFQEAGLRFETMSKEIGTRAYDAIAERAERFRTAIDAHAQAAGLLEAQIRELMARLDPRLLPREEWERVLAALNAAAAREQEHREALRTHEELLAGLVARLSGLAELQPWLESRLPDDSRVRDSRTFAGEVDTPALPNPRTPAR